MSFTPKVVNLSGLKVVLVPDDRETVTVRALIGTGSREEEADSLGSAHFLEHFVLRGTRKYPVDINAYVDGLGGVIDAYTSQETLSFMVKLGREKTETAVDLVGQLVSEPLLPMKLIEGEKKIITEEIKFRDDDPETKAFREMWRQMYRRSNLGRPIAGTFETVAATTVAKLRHYLDHWFVPGNVIVGVVGNWEDEKKVLEQIEESFAPLIARGKTKLSKDVYVVEDQKRPRVELVTRKSMQQTAVYLGFRSFGVGDKMVMSRILMNILLGGGCFSRLFREIREKRGWAYSIGSFPDALSDTGALMVGAGLPRDKIVAAFSLIKEIIYGLGGAGKWGVKPKELTLTKDCYKGRVSLKYDSPQGVLGSALYDLMFEGRMYSAEQLKKEADEVTIEQIREVCKMIFVPEHLCVGVVGNYEKLPFSL